MHTVSTDIWTFSCTCKLQYLTLKVLRAKVFWHNINTRCTIVEVSFLVAPIFLPLCPILCTDNRTTLFVWGDILLIFFRAASTPYFLSWLMLVVRVLVFPHICSSKAPGRIQCRKKVRTSKRGITRTCKSLSTKTKFASSTNYIDVMYVKSFFSSGILVFFLAKSNFPCSSISTISHSRRSFWSSLHLHFGCYVRRVTTVWNTCQF